MSSYRICSECPVSAIEPLEKIFHNGGTSIVQAALAHTYFLHPDEVRRKTPYFPDRARTSEKFYPGVRKGESTTWEEGDKREIILDDNAYPQRAWEYYSKHKLARGSGYSVRHIWGTTHNPEAFTAGWNMCYMPFWAAEVTEDQHRLPELQTAIRQASWDLFFAQNPVCERPDFVKNPKEDLNQFDPLLVLCGETRPSTVSPSIASRHSGALPISLEPANQYDFLACLLRSKEAWIEVTYSNGCKDVRRWDASRMGPRSNVINNLRSRLEFRRGEWQRNGIVSVRVSIERPLSPSAPLPSVRPERREWAVHPTG